MLKRFSVSLDEKLLAQFDDYIRPRGYSNRSEAVRDLIRKMLVNEEWEQDSEVVGVVTLVYNHHQPQLQEKITELQHDYHHQITSTTHVHMDHDNCLEVTIVKGRASQVRELAEQLIALRGVKNGNLTMSSTGGHLH
ncbi:transcriptional regulator, CopG family [Desulfobulbus propionicus DSM 2032]|jgi:CopG family nickel-responsive transcriptional regulator|uniref:Putative nickel-responsive regulator n=1 Tax=Desulfobulbus propionicus (strain ATCC 33891 / DSM 2032 / VKM B-1956 / 1pr3) TaxID=577650 RepID=A0A7U4DP73_DESPD|nr:nickel-responsive transcriptional regulator NikR [Desulfobulbus propionicus]ADW17861.1 transcriptional regulator, CopG family [Desulfobulbus propionicus DSM 2032]